MSTTDIIPAATPVRQGPTQQRLARMQAEAMVMARSSLVPDSLRMTGHGLNKSVRPVEDIAADVMAIALTADGFGVPVNLATLGQFAVIGGQAVPSTQLLCGVAERSYGHDVWLKEATLDRAVACMVHRQTGREHRVIYTVEDAIASGALDVTVEHWVDRKCVETLVLGRSMEEALAVRAKAPDWAKTGRMKFNPAWQNYRADMLAWRALRRVLKRGAPSVVAGLPSDEEVFGRVATTTPGEQIPAVPPPLDGGDASDVALEAGPAQDEAPAASPAPPAEQPDTWGAGPLPSEAESAEELAEFDRRRKAANAAMGEHGIRSDDARHEFDGDTGPVEP